MAVHRGMRSFVRRATALAWLDARAAELTERRRTRTANCSLCGTPLDLLGRVWTQNWGGDAWPVWRCAAIPTAWWRCRPRCRAGRRSKASRPPRRWRNRGGLANERRSVPSQPHSVASATAHRSKLAIDFSPRADANIGRKSSAMMCRQFPTLQAPTDRSPARVPIRRGIQLSPRSRRRAVHQARRRPTSRSKPRSVGT